MRVRPSTLLVIGVVIIVAPFAPVVWAHSPAVWFALGVAFILAGLGRTFGKRRGRRTARDSSAHSHHFIVCPHCDAKNFASRDACRYCEEEF